MMEGMLKHNRTLPSPHYEPATNTHGEGEIGCKDTTNKNGMRRNWELYLLFLMSTFRDQLLIEFFRWTYNNHISHLTRAFFSKIKTIFLLAQSTPVPLPGPTDHGWPTRKQIVCTMSCTLHAQTFSPRRTLKHNQPLHIGLSSAAPGQIAWPSSVTQRLSSVHQKATWVKRRCAQETTPLPSASRTHEPTNNPGYDITVHDTNNLHIQI